MIKKRLIFTLLYNEGKYCLSRNFKLQAVGDLGWIIENYDFDQIAYSIDELVVLNVSRSPTFDSDFQESIRRLARYCFIPISIGGGIRSLEDAYRALDIGADKIVVNTMLIKDNEGITRILEIFGSQFVVGSIDYKAIGSGNVVFAENGKRDSGSELVEFVRRIARLGVGEIYLNSIVRDGTGQGFDIETLKNVSDNVTIPIIAAGGAGRPDHFAEALRLPGVTGAATANLFNFMAGGLFDARKYLLDNGIPLAKWSLCEGPGK